jgi:hypothetical protein
MTDNRKRGKLPRVPQTEQEGIDASQKLKNLESGSKLNQSYGERGSSSNKNIQSSNDATLSFVNEFLQDDYGDGGEEDIGFLDQVLRSTVLEDEEDLYNKNVYGFDDDTSAIGLHEVTVDEEFECFDYNDLLTNKSIIHFQEIFKRSGRRRFPIDSLNPVNPNLPVPEDPKLIKTKQMLAVRISEIQASAGLSDKTVLLFMEVWNEFCPGMDLPILPVGENGNFKLDLEKYTVVDDRKYKVHCCPLGCTAYIGDNALDIVCGECKTARFRPCTDDSHNENPLAACGCNPFTGGHSIKRRIALRSFFYRPMLPLFQSMDRWSRETNNGVYDYDASRMRDGNINDVLDGKNPKSNLEEMHQMFNEKKSLNANLVEVSFVLSQFYDGGTLFNRSAKSVWPLAISILNCNPTDRMDYGIGLFMIILHDLKIGSVVETAIFKQLLIPELQLLRRGVEYSYLNDKGEKVEIFLQVRLVVHIMDTVALTKKAQLYGIMFAYFIIRC